MTDARTPANRLMEFDAFRQYVRDVIRIHVNSFEKLGREPRLRWDFHVESGELLTRVWDDKRGHFFADALCKLGETGLSNDQVEDAGREVVKGVMLAHNKFVNAGGGNG